MSYVTDKIDERIAGLLEQGGVGLLPSDTIYGLSGLALDEAAVERIHKLKGRTADKPFIVLIPSLGILNMLSISSSQAGAVQKYWPGPLSVVFDAPAAPAWLLRGGRSLAVRLPDNPALVKLMDQVGPLISTSANLAGQPPIHSAAAAQGLFGGQLDFYVDAGGLNNPPSTVVKLEDGKLKVLRQGAVRISRQYDF